MHCAAGAALALNHDEVSLVRGNIRDDNHGLAILNVVSRVTAPDTSQRAETISRSDVNAKNSVERASSGANYKGSGNRRHVSEPAGTATILVADNWLARFVRIPLGAKDLRNTVPAGIAAVPLKRQLCLRER